MRDSKNWISDDQNRRCVDGVEYVAVTNTTARCAPCVFDMVGGCNAPEIESGWRGLCIDEERLDNRNIHWQRSTPQATTDAATARDMAKRYQGRLYGMPRDTELAEAINAVVVLLAQAAVELDKVARLEVE